MGQLGSKSTNSNNEEAFRNEEQQPQIVSRRKHSLKGKLLKPFSGSLDLTKYQLKLRSEVANWSTTSLTSGQSFSVMSHPPSTSSSASTYMWYEVSDEERRTRGAQDEFLHYLLAELLGKPHLAPLSRPAIGLEIGCGTGVWIMDMASRFPSCQWHGIDSQPIYPQDIHPQNSYFHGLSILREQMLPFSNGHFDYVRVVNKSTSLAIPHWTPVLEEIWRLTKPGGWIELGELGQHLDHFNDNDNVLSCDLGEDAEVGDLTCPVNEIEQLLEKILLQEWRIDPKGWVRMITRLFLGPPPSPLPATSSASSKDSSSQRLQYIENELSSLQSPWWDLRDVHYRKFCLPVGRVPEDLGEVLLRANICVDPQLAPATPKRSSNPPSSLSHTLPPLSSCSNNSAPGTPQPPNYERIAQQLESFMLGIYTVIGPTLIKSGIMDVDSFSSMLEKWKMDISTKGSWMDYVVVCGMKPI